MSDPIAPTPATTPVPPSPATSPGASPVAMSYATPFTDGILPPGYIEPDLQQRSMAMVAFLLGFAGGFIGPLVLYLIKKDDPTTSPYLRDQMKESLNWQLTVLCGAFICIPLFLVIIGIFLWLGLIITSLVYMIMNAVKANRGEVGRFPWRIRFVK